MTSSGVVGPGDLDEQSVAKRAPLSARQRRRRIALLILLLLLLLGLGFGAWYWFSNRAVPLPVLQADPEMLNPPQYLYSITGSGKDAIDRPVGIDVAPDGRVYVVDFAKQRISVFTRTGRFLFSFNKIDKGTLQSPVHMQIKNGEVWVTDRALSTICIFDLNGVFKRRFEPKNEPDLKWTPLALAFDSRGALRATDVYYSDRHQLMYFSEDESRTVTLGKTQQVNEANAAAGSFYFPNGLAVAPSGDVYVSDGNNRRVQVFDKKGAFRFVIDTSGVPRGLAMDTEKRLYVVDALAHAVDIYDLEGKRLTTFGSHGYGPGQFSFPNDVATDTRGNIYITDRENDQVQVWGWPQLVVPATVVPQETWQWGLCFTPLLFLPLLLLLRKKRYVLTPAFLMALIDAERADLLAHSRVRFIAPELDRAAYGALVLPEGLDLERIVTFEPHSTSDVSAMKDKLRCSELQAAYLTMGDRTHGLLAEDAEMRRFGVLVRVRVLNVSEFLQEVDRKARNGAKRGPK